jgi:hypothetical protein
LTTRIFRRPSNKCLAIKIKATRRTDV